MVDFYLVPQGKVYVIILWSPFTNDVTVIYSVIFFILFLFR